MTWEAFAAASINGSYHTLNSGKIATTKRFYSVKKMEISVNRTGDYYSDETYFRTKKAGRGNGNG
jgi:hypothetical protein